MGVDCQPLAKNGWHARDSLSVPTYVRVDKKINNHAQYNGAHAHPPYPQVYLRSMVRTYLGTSFVGRLCWLVSWLVTRIFSWGNLDTWRQAWTQPEMMGIMCGC